jgi:hypothetical protein
MIFEIIMSLFETGVTRIDSIVFSDFSKYMTAPVYIMDIIVTSRIMTSGRSIKKTSVSSIKYNKATHINVTIKLINVTLYF